MMDTSKSSTTDFYIRQLWDGKASAEVETMAADVLRRYATACGAALGRAHARSGDASTISGYIGDDDVFDRAVARFAEAYADRTELDHDELIGAVDDGKVSTVRDL
jgi:hypothetical protein